MRDISHPTAVEQGLIYCPHNEGIRFHVSIYNTAASKEKKGVLVFLLFSSLAAEHQFWE